MSHPLDHIVLSEIGNNQKDNYLFMLPFIKEDGFNLQYASDRLRYDKEFVKIALKENGLSILYASDELLSDKELCIMAVKSNCEAIRYTPMLQNSYYYMSECIRQKGYLIVYASYELKNNKELNLLAMYENVKNIKYLLKHFQKDSEILSLVNQNKGYMYA